MRRRSGWEPQFILLHAYGSRYGEGRGWRGRGGKCVVDKGIESVQGREGGLGREVDGRGGRRVN